MEEFTNPKSDVAAKKAFKKRLEELDYENVQIKGSPADIIAEKNGETYYFEIKMTKQSEVYFGAATLTEWMAAFLYPNNFKFVIAKTDVLENDFEFIEYTPEEFMEHSTIPPFKIYFTVNLDGETKARKRRSAIPLTKETLELLTLLHKQMRE